MNDGDGCLGAGLACGVIILILFMIGHSWGYAKAYTDWRECRTLLTTQDSTAVLAARPACAQWTWPPKEDTR